MKPAISYVIASIQRSGTHLLCSILRSTGVAGSPAEFFCQSPEKPGRSAGAAPSRDWYIERVLQDNTGTNGVFGAVMSKLLSMCSKFSAELIAATVGSGGDLAVFSDADLHATA